MENDIVAVVDADSGWDLTVTAVVLTSGQIVFDATDISFS